MATRTVTVRCPVCGSEKVTRKRTDTTGRENRYTAATIRRVTGKVLWTGKRDVRQRLTTEHDTVEAAVGVLHALADKYPNTVNDAVILIDDLTE